MIDCSYYKEEAPFFYSIGSDVFEVEMIPICTKPGIEALGVPCDITSCSGNPDNCPYKIQEKGFFQY
ncbi:MULTISPECIES: hypothetical protein [unclassified Oceanispirochaeta]|uniref:hypothetical protein n=1 Tax=unclassified Oceanispirochaeta TaxID=2635722 RepID=UPI000E096D37|nr:MULTISPECIES: hypothetical protein [unclassified Oceanispirochaeta]MBF9018406.1 hypothetical protein [Oceanispirochaeta sp. M2]NPD75218.1 hypothetical protein [Oceanispirochaeta sp. M1]RDG28935.1 hypothetical protein DV872_24285 [Oceanispirochaeta sp. M1]